MRLFTLPSIVATFTLTSSTVTTTGRRPSSQLFSSSPQMDWSPLAPARLSVEPEALVTSGATPQLAKDADYAREIQQAWRSELWTDSESESKPYTYQDTNGATCYGHLIRRKKGLNTPEEAKVPGILFLHTGAGPHDVCLHWKADSLVTNRDVFPHGCVVLVADILSDESGWSWSSDRTKYNAARGEVFALDADGARRNLQIKMHAALNELKAMPAVDGTRLAAMGWCLGGHSVLELSRMKPTGMQAMATFHGVFDGMPPTDRDQTTSKDGCRILICNGAEDPFVSESSLQNAMDTMKQHGHTVTLLELKGAKHGFTNPAQKYNANDAFRFSEEGAELAWSSALDLLQSV